MTWEQVRQLGEHGHELASHGFTHTSFLRLTPEGMCREIEQNDSAIYANTGFHLRTLCFPDSSVFWAHLAYAKQLCDTGILWVATFADVSAYCKGVSDTVTYLLPRKPKHVKHGKCRLKPYQSCDGTWCVDAPRGAKLRVR